MHMQMHAINVYMLIICVNDYYLYNAYISMDVIIIKEYYIYNFNSKNPLNFTVYYLLALIK